jgi:REP element-mobilizing transposase RayT
MQVLKQRVSRRRRALGRSKGHPKKSDEEVPPAFWLPRFYDFDVFTKKKITEKLRYMHRNPVTRGLVESPKEWRWSSYRYYALGEEGPVKIEG